MTHSADELYAANDYAARWYARHAGSGLGRYLVTRGIAPSQIDRGWRLGMAPAAWSALVHEMQDAGFAPSLLVEAGLARYTTRGRLIDVFRDRIMFPVLDVDARCLGFTGRDLSGASDRPKYLNTRSTAIYTKGHELFGAHQLPTCGDRSVVLVEGPLDALAIENTHSPGAPVAVTSFGTAFTRCQAELLRRWLRPTATILVAMDGDAAGRRGALAAGRMLHQVGFQPLIARLPDGLDPCTYLSAAGQDGLGLLFDRAAPLLAAELRAVVEHQGERMRWIEGRLAAASELADALGHYPSEEIRELAPSIGAALQLQESTVIAVLERARRADKERRPASAPERIEDTRSDMAALNGRLRRSREGLRLEYDQTPNRVR